MCCTWSTHKANRLFRGYNKIKENRMADKNLVCRDCGREFVFNESEQAFYKEKGFENEPTRCLNCRKERKQQRSGGGYGGRGNNRSY
jgi:hypothetical protein